MFVFGFKQQTCAVQRVTYDMNVIEEMEKEGYPHPEIQQEQGWVNEIGQSLDSGEFDFIVIVGAKRFFIEYFQCYAYVDISTFRILFSIGKTNPSDDEKTFITDKVNGFICNTQSISNNKTYI